MNTGEMRRDDVVALMRKLGACSEPGEAVPWADSLPEDTTPEGAWGACDRGDWIVWFLGEMHRRGALPRQPLVLAVCAAADVGHPDFPAVATRPRGVVGAARRWARGEATVDEVHAARVGAHAAYASDVYAARTVEAISARDAAANGAVSCVGDHSRGAVAVAVRAAVPWAVVENALRTLGG